MKSINWGQQLVHLPKEIFNSLNSFALSSLSVFSKILFPLAISEIPFKNKKKG